MILIIVITEEDLNKIRKRDPEIFTNIYNEYKKKIYNFIIIKTNGNANAADEIFSETFYSALASAPNIKNADNILGWLLSIANRRLYDYINKENKNQDCIEGIINVESIEHNMIKSEQTEKNEDGEKLLMVKTAMANLKPLYKEILNLKYTEKKSQKEIADILKKSRSSVESLIFRAKEALKKELKGLTKDF